VAKGDPGADAGVRYRFSTATADANPGNGYLRLNNANPALATRIYIHDADADGQSFGAIVGQWIQNGTRGEIILRQRGSTFYRQFRVTGFDPAQPFYQEIHVEHRGGGGVFVNDAELLLSLLERGPQGDVGPAPAITFAPTVTGARDPPPASRSAARPRHPSSLSPSQEVTRAPATCWRPTI
jgi:hypothetical protein